MERSWLHLALFLALAVLLQGLRLFLPMIPGPVQMFFIGSLLKLGHAHLKLLQLLVGVARFEHLLHEADYAV